MTLKEIFSIPSFPLVMKREMEAEYILADKIILFLLVVQWLVVTFVTSVPYDTYALGSISGALIVLIASIGFVFFKGTRAMRVLSATAMMMFSVIYIQQYFGLIEMHFSIFIILALLTLYRDFVPIFVAGTISIVHHVVFNYLQLYDVKFFDMPIMIFNYGCGWDIVMIHAVFVLIEMAVLGFIVKVHMSSAIEYGKMHHEVKNLNNDLDQMANLDALTGIANRFNLYNQLEHVVKQSERDKSSFALLFLDLDHFKNINDSLGHDVGDALLIAAVDRIRPVIRKSDIFARLGGDEFIIVLSDVQLGHSLSMVIEKILELFRQGWNIQGHQLNVLCSIGIAIYPNDGNDIQTLMKHADIAMYRSKELGRNNFSFFSEDFNQKLIHQIALEQSMSSAIEAQQFELYFQPKVEISSGAIIGAEALIRWNHPTRGLVFPGEFIGIAESTGFIINIGDWVIGATCNSLVKLRELGLDDIHLSFNISTRQFQHTDVASVIQEHIAASNIDPSLIYAEITESIMLENAEIMTQKLHDIRDMGVHLCMDDFGTGYSSLAYLHQFPIDSLKIDKSFVDQIQEGKKESILLDTILVMGDTLGLNVLAEGVEEAYQLEYLRDLGCEYYQGYYCSKAVPFDDFVTMVAENRNHHQADRSC